MQVSSETVLPAPIERAWEVLMRWEDQAIWMKDADSVRVVSPHREGAGVVLAVKTRVLNVPLFTEKLEAFGVVELLPEVERDARPRRPGPREGLLDEPQQRPVEVLGLMHVLDDAELAEISEER